MQDGIKSPTRWVVLFTLVMGMIVMNIGNFVFSTNPGPMMAKYNMDQAQLTALTTISLLPGAFFSIILGNFFDKKGPKAVRFVGAAMIAAAALCQLARVYVDSYGVLVVLTFLSGSLFLPTQVLPAKLIGAWFDAKRGQSCHGYLFSCSWHRRSSRLRFGSSGSRYVHVVDDLLPCICSGYCSVGILSVSFPRGRSSGLHTARSWQRWFQGAS